MAATNSTRSSPGRRHPGSLLLAAIIAGAVAGAVVFVCRSSPPASSPAAETTPSTPLPVPVPVPTGLPRLAAAFGRHHDAASFADYESLRAHSAEAAWIATEGNAFNHATDRVADVGALSERLKAEGRPMKDKVEVSASGRVRQTAFRADTVERSFADGTARAVPGSFYEFISRAIDPETGGLDLGFDSGNATGIFAMTRAA